MRVGAGSPPAVTVKLPEVPAVKVVDAAEVTVGAAVKLTFTPPVTVSDCPNPSATVMLRGSWACTSGPGGSV